MEISSAAMPSTVSPVDVESLRFREDANPEEVAKSFEAVFASMLIKEMRNTLSEGFFGAEGSDVFGSLFDLHIGEAVTEGQGLGIKQMVLDHLQRTAT